MEPGDAAPSPIAFTSHSRLSCTPCRSKKQRCDRTLPACDRCGSVGLTCAYPGARKSHVGKPKQVRDLEAKLQQLESRLDVIGTGAGTAVGNNSPLPGMVPLVVAAASISGSLESTPSINLLQSQDFGAGESHENLDNHDDGDDDGHQIWSNSPMSQPVSPAVSVDLLEHLTALYFDKCHEGSPMIHCSRYMTALRCRSASQQPPLFLQYVIMATGATMDARHASLATSLYQQARKLAEADEVEDSGVDQPSVAHAQCWLLLANLEAQNAMFARSYLSLGRSIRFAQLLNLHQLDQVDHRQTLFCHHSPPRDWIEREERRRTWWVIYVADRLVFATSGMPALINDDQIHTLLPATEEAFDEEREEPAISLRETLQKKSTTQSRLAVRVIASHLYYRTVDLESRLALDQNHSFPRDDEDFWAQHQSIDNSIMFTRLQLPQTLQLPRNSNSQCAVFTNVLLHTADICLQKTALRKSRGFEGVDAEFIRRQSQTRMLAAAGQIVAMFRLASDLVSTLRNPILDYTAYITALMFVEDFAVSGNMDSRKNISFFFRVFRLGSSHVAKMLAGQLTAKVEELGLTIESELDQASPSVASAMQTP
ncbi:hypothetical protein E8E14_004046 [Neopestalotiopsis sp. 37M]|nr:hypothetical protein E8E14_004046 [Neopestalotiopsis sp. 37M]